MINTGNRGEWAEVAAKCHYLINGYFIDGHDGRLLRFDGMWNGTGPVAPLSDSPTGVSVVDARRMLAEGIKIIAKGQGRTFPNPPLKELCTMLDIKQMKAHSNEKPDIILRTGGSYAAYFIENPTSSASSFVNASPTTRIRYHVVRRNGRPLADADRSMLLRRYGRYVFTDGHRKVKTRVQAMAADGFKIAFNRVPDEGFAANTAHIGHDQLGCLCNDYLMAKGVSSIRDVLEIHKDHAPRFKDTREQFLAFIRDSILERGPSREMRDPKVHCYGEGMIFLIILEQGSFKLYRASNGRWWADRIEEGARFDTPDAMRHDYGYVFDDLGELAFDYALGIRGTFRRLLDAGA